MESQYERTEKYKNYRIVDYLAHGYVMSVSYVRKKSIKASVRNEL